MHMLEKGAKAYPIVFREDTGYWYVRHFKTYPRTVTGTGVCENGRRGVFFREDGIHGACVPLEDIFETFREASLACEERNEELDTALSAGVLCPS